MVRIAFILACTSLTLLTGCSAVRTDVDGDAVFKMPSWTPYAYLAATVLGILWGIAVIRDRESEDAKPATPPPAGGSEAPPPVSQNEVEGSSEPQAETPKEGSARTRWIIGIGMIVVSVGFFGFLGVQSIFNRVQVGTDKMERQWFVVSGFGSQSITYSDLQSVSTKEEFTRRRRGSSTDRTATLTFRDGHSDTISVAGNVHDAWSEFQARATAKGVFFSGDTFSE